MKNFSAVSRLILLGLMIVAPLSRAQTIQTIAEREVARRQASAPHGTKPSPALRQNCNGRSSLKPTRIFAWH